MNILLKTIGLFLFQNGIEILGMAVLAKLGIPYMDFKAGGENMIELVIGIAYYYSMSKVLITLLPYIVLMLLGHRYIFKELRLLNIIISMILTIAFWLYFDNPIFEMLNPALGTLVAGTFIFFVGRSIKGRNLKANAN